MNQNTYRRYRLYLFANSYTYSRMMLYLREKCDQEELERSAKRLEEIMGLSYRKLKHLIFTDVKPVSPIRSNSEDVDIYLAIEKEMLLLSKERIEADSTIWEDYRSQLLYPALERAAGNSLTEIEDDYVFEEELSLKIKKYKYMYYKVVNDYKLPTMKIIPFILRLIIGL